MEKEFFLGQPWTYDSYILFQVVDEDYFLMILVAINFPMERIVFAFLGVDSAAILCLDCDRHVSPTVLKVLWILMEWLQIMRGTLYTVLFLLNCKQSRHLLDGQLFHVQILTRNITYAFFRNAHSTSGHIAPDINFIIDF